MHINSQIQIFYHLIWIMYWWTVFNNTIKDTDLNIKKDA